MSSARLTQLATTVAPCWEYDEVPDDAQPPYSVLHGGAANPVDRFFCTSADRTTYRLIAVSNNRIGAVALAAAYRAAIEEQMDDGDPYLVTYVSDPIPDRDDTRDTLWTSTLEIRHHPRS